MTPILPFIQERLKPTRKEIDADLFLWLSGKKFPNLEFSGSLVLNYWGPYLDGHIQKIIDTAFATNKEIAKEHNLDPTNSVNDAVFASTETIKSLLEKMADYDQRMRGKGYPKSVPRRDIAQFYTKSNELIRIRAENEINFFKYANKKEENSEKSPNTAIHITDNAKNNIFIGCKVNGGVKINKNAEGNNFLQTEITSTEVPYPASGPPANPTNKEHNWQNKTLYYIAVGVIIALLATFIVYLIRNHLGVPL